jgi:hypothetical protein
VPLRAAPYIRVPTDHQENSPVLQRQAIADYALAHHIGIVREYEDAGISGLTLRERPRSYSDFWMWLIRSGSSAVCSCTTLAVGPMPGRR